MSFNSAPLNSISSVPTVTLGELIEVVDIRGGAIDPSEVEGVNINKMFVPTVANLKNTDLSKYKHVPPNAFAANLMHIGRDQVFPVALNTTNTTKFVSPAYFVFQVRDPEIIVPEFLAILFLNPSFDKRTWFSTDSSIRGNLPWNELCKLQIPLPSIKTQKAYVDIYNGLTKIIKDNEELTKFLERTEQAFIVKCREKWNFTKLGPYIKRTDKRNTNNEIKEVKGLSTTKRFRPPSSKVNKDNLTKYKIVLRDQFAFVQTTNNEKCLVTCLSDFNFPIIVSSVNEVFEIVDTNKLLPKYLYLQFLRPEFDRYARFNSWGSARETFNWDDMCRVKIPLPPIDVQQAIVALHDCTEEARKIAEEAKVQLAQVCPAMIQRAAHRL